MHRILFDIGPFTVYSYGLMVALGFLLSTFLILRDSKKFGFSKDDVFDCLIAILIGGIIGGRILFAVINSEYFIQHPLKVFMLNEGGLAIQGAIVAAVLAGILIARIKKLPFWKCSDLIVPYIALGQAIGRIGCFLNGCCYGREAGSALAVTFPGDTVARIPVQIYSSISLILIFMVLLSLRDKRPFDGYLFVMYLVLYSFFRFFMDFFRGDDLASWGGMTLSQLISIGMFACGTIIFFVLWIGSKKKKQETA
jgi:phosphatidylglycerol:prolipoprotein diacylglycerol transferase